MVAGDPLDPNLLNGTAVNDRYVLLECLGTGPVAAIYAADEVLEGHRVASAALKFVRPADEAEWQCLLRQAGIMAGLSHSKELAYRGVGKVWHGPLEGCVYLAMEKADETLEHLLEAATVPALSLVRDMTRDVCRGLFHLHSEGIIHRDLRPGNVLRAGSLWKVGGFSMARTVAELRRQPAQLGGALIYTPPEALYQQIGTGGDMWALGVMLQVALCGLVPYQATTVPELRQAVEAAGPRVERQLPTPFDRIVPACLTRDLDRRWTARQVLDLLG